MRTVIHIWLLLSLLSANNNLDYVFEYFINGIPSDDPIEYKIDSNFLKIESLLRSDQVHHILQVHQLK